MWPSQRQVAVNQCLRPHATQTATRIKGTTDLCFNNSINGKSKATYSRKRYAERRIGCSISPIIKHVIIFSLVCQGIGSQVIKVCDLSWLPALSRLWESGLLTASIRQQGRLNKGTMMHKLIHRAGLVSLGSGHGESVFWVNKHCPI